ncbi:MAG: HD domain-containing protein [Candidatus Edwardsbacteria bacterium]|nr:HD domain-containing protein [Candidatus Edwardsbacteria bacterium]MBU1576957.1 HD domain-containing protein [Candidatus Edwardsbacteria bacterium]MBU2463287.1 HD domain-containing protein [Candidatus Edwardsbacteria bacterium]MBU2594616.1 HD domain-containing protein [Candidatus Edwardsbacteria bacterium]
MYLPKKIIDSVNSIGQIYEVGGAVRDRIRYALSLDTARIDPKKFWSFPPEEVDYLVTGMPMNALTSELKQFGHVELVGKSFGVIKFKLEIQNPKSKIYDIALPRRETSTGLGHRDFEIEFDPDLPVEQDLGRRDFTVNAIALRIQNSEFRIQNPELIDPYNGLQDIKDRLIRMVNPQAFKEDPLRMLRACQFAARFQFSIEQDTFKAIKKNAKLIRTVSPERVQQELNKMLLKADQPSIGLWLMQRSGLLKEIFPELEEGVDVTQPGGYHRYKVFEHSIKSVDFAPKILEMRLAALLHDIAKPRCREVFQGGAHFYGHDKLGEKTAKELMERLKYSGETISRVALLVRRHMFAFPETEKGLRRLIAKVGINVMYDLIELRRADISAQGRGTEEADSDLDLFEQAITEVINKNPPFTINDLQLDGVIVMAEFHLKPGPEVGRVLRHLLDYVLDHPEKNKRDLLLDEAARWLGTG